MAISCTVSETKRDIAPKSSVLSRRALLASSAAYAVMRCPSVRLSVRVRPSRSYILSKWIKISSKFLDSKRISGFAMNNGCTLVCILHLATGFLFTAGIGRPSATRCTQSRLSVTVYSARAIHIHGRPWIACMAARLDVTPKTTEHNRIVRRVLVNLKSK